MKRAFLHGFWLAIARFVWIGITIMVIGLSIAGIPARAQALQVFGTPILGLPITGGEYILFWEIIFAMMFIGAAILIFHLKSDNWSVLLLVLTLIAIGATEPGMTDEIIKIYPIWSWPIRSLRSIAMICSLILLYLFPTGHFVPRWTFVLAIVWTICNIVWLFKPGALPYSVIDGAAFSKDPKGVVLFGLCWFSTGILAQIYRYTHTINIQERQQTKWIMLGLITAVLGVLFYYGLSSIVPTLESDFKGKAYIAVRTPLYVMLMLAALVCIGVAILRYQLWNIDIVINRTLVYAALTASVVVLYGLIVGVLSLVLHMRTNPAFSLVATGVIAVLFQPLRVRLQHSVNHLMYGDRDDPYTVLAQLGQRLQGTLTPTAILPTIVTTLCDVLKLPYAAIELHEEDHVTVASVAGTPGPIALRLPMVYQDAPIGQLLLGARAPGESFSHTERRLLANLAYRAAVAAHALHLTRELQRARERLVITREAERQRIRRDLHDGLGPQLASQMWVLDTVGQLLDQNPTQARPLIAELKTQSQAAITNIRRLVEGLRPPALDELGLVGMLYEYIAQYRYSGLEIVLQAATDLPPMPAAVDVAAYRIVQEALTNVVRHAQARRCAITLQVQNGLQITIADDGRGLGMARNSGMGLSNMRERAEELGGACVVTRGPHSGTIVTARLPLA
jgi:signal transduction histidine kinase